MKKILVVDDEKDVAELLQLVLSKHGYAPLVASSGMDGLALAQSELPDLVLLDIMMHRMDGWEALKLLKLDDRTAAIPVVILSARAEPKDKIRGLQEGAVDYVTKPFAVADLLRTVATVLAPAAQPAPPAHPANPADPEEGGR
jgi:DNA-binding response OmpR family regulator